MDNPKTHDFYEHQLIKSKKPIKVKKKPIKVTYISSPVMVQANNASEFRAIVEELTGQNSDVSRFEDASMAFGNDAGPVLDPEISTTKTVLSDGHEFEYLSDMMQPLEFNESSFLREVSNGLGFQFPCVLV
ncbi:sigma factor binding protein 1, chloroplastic-like [Actinidia eriantha]|uniref:sigma factor binding protein 1, chloroplastic-like n=1 Tax=Actinidia eriantha TaxID=165200 RepID=UPI002586F9FC|nr:sigma factor binding protein 1, chloroplastic-like [Actinidia eriantha]